tara:strand:+ start:583 stop:1977 length:1395 start_codon:yes stop_codon:yes gene_type:complete
MKFINLNPLFFLGLIWFVPSVYFVLFPSYSPSTLPVWFSILFTLLLSIYNRKILIFSLPFISLLSPIAGPNNLLPFLPSEIYILMIFIVGFFYKVFTRDTKLILFKGDAYLLIIFGLVLLSFFSSLEIISLFKSLMSWIMIATIFLLSRFLIKDEEDIKVVLGSIVFSSFFVCLIIFASYFSGINLSDFLLASDEKTILTLGEDTSYIRGTYFYSNIGYILGSAALIAFLMSIYVRTFFLKPLLVIVFLMNLLAILILVEKTALAGLFISLILLIPLYLMKNFKSFFSLLFFGMMAVIIFYLVNFLMGSLFLDFQIAGLEQRLCVVGSATNVLLENPLRIMFGFGPDATNILDNSNIRNSMINCVNAREYAIDSGAMTFLFEYGLFFILVFYLFCFHSLIRIISYLKNRKEKQDILFCIFSAIIFINICMLTDVLGTSKVMWLVAVIFSLIGIALQGKESQFNK